MIDIEDILRCVMLPHDSFVCYFKVQFRPPQGLTQRFSSQIKNQKHRCHQCRFYKVKAKRNVKKCLTHTPPASFDVQCLYDSKGRKIL